MNGSYDPIHCCDPECAGINHCAMGGIPCERCGRYFCAHELDGNNLCADCEKTIAEEQEEEEE